MLSGTVETSLLEEIEWPVLCSPKIDGIRCIVHPEKGPVTRSFKSIPNTYVKEVLETIIGDHCLDGELIALDDNGNEMSFNETQSAMMSHGGKPRFKYCVFDCFQNPTESYTSRYVLALAKVVHVRNILKVETDFACNKVEMVEHHLVQGPEDFLSYNDLNIANGYEGTMIRAKDGPYKNGRSTFRQGWLLKYKHWTDAEGWVIGFKELMHNDNMLGEDEFGYAKRSSALDGMIPGDTLGSLILSIPDFGEGQFLEVGSGFDQSMRKHIWDNRLKYLGVAATFKYQAYGMKDKPRFPIFKGFRYD